MRTRWMIGLDQTGQRNVWEYRDTFLLPSPFNTIVGTLGDDVLTGTSLAETIEGLAGNDTLSGLGGDDILNGGDGDDILDGGSGSNALNGGAGDDVLTSSGFVDTLDGGIGNDTFYLGDALSTQATNVRGGSGDDTFFADDDLGTDGRFDIDGGDGIDRLTTSEVFTDTVNFSVVNVEIFDGNSSYLLGSAKTVRVVAGFLHAFDDVFNVGRFSVASS